MSETNNNRYNANPEEKESFREEYRRIFKDRPTGVHTGKWILTSEGLVPFDQAKRDKPGVTLRVRDKSTEFIVERVKKDLNHETHIDGGYRTI